MRRLTSASLALALLAPASPVAAADPAERPRLVVMLVVDQMRNDYIDDYGGRWTGGLRRLGAEGARFRNAAYPYFNTVTCAGHATISTGTVPAVHGIVLNQWWHRDEGKELSCTDDPASPTISYGNGKPGGGHSARRLKVPSFAQTLDRAQGDRAHVVTISLKPRSAIMLAGASADAVTWFEGTAFATSSAFSRTRVVFVDQFISSSPIERDLGKSWERMWPASAYKYADDGEGEKPTTGWTRVFPHRLGGWWWTGATDEFYGQWTSSPFADEYLERMAEAAIDGLRLGQGTTTDYLGVSFSSLDSVGHKFGPRSHEVQDLLARLDLTIGRLLDHLDARVGRGKYVLALSADHGVAVIPEQLRREGKDAGRAVMDAVSARAEAAIASAFGPGKYVARMDYTQLYFLAGVFDRLTAAGRLDAVIEAIEQVPGVLRVIDSRTLDPHGTASDPLVQAAALSEFRGRSGDLFVIPRTNWFWVADDGTPTPGDATTHGTAYPYDVRVPLLLLGAGVRPGQYEQAATPADIAPTLAEICGVALPTATGRTLDEAIAKWEPRSTGARSRGAGR